MGLFPLTQGKTNELEINREASNWTADRLRANNPRFHINDETNPIFFTGEMVSFHPLTDIEARI